jgi:hypothetical protein
MIQRIGMRKIFTLFVTPAFAAVDLGPEPAQIGHFNTIFSTILNLATAIGLLVVFIMLLLGGFSFLTAGGDPKANEGAKKTITYAILGLAMMIMAWFALQLIQAFTGVNVSIFNILFP